MKLNKMDQEMFLLGVILTVLVVVQACPAPFTRVGTSCLHVHHHRMGYAAGMEYCRDIGGARAHLVYLLTQEKHDMVKNWLDTEHRQARVMTGGMRGLNTDRIQWMDLFVTPRWSGSPKNGCQECVFLAMDVSKNGHVLSDVRPSNKRLPLCEKAGREPVASVAGSDVTIVEPEPEITRPTRRPLDVTEIELQPHVTRIEPEPIGITIEPEPDVTMIEPGPIGITIEPEPSVTMIEPEPNVTRREPAEETAPVVAAEMSSFSKFLNFLKSGTNTEKIWVLLPFSSDNKEKDKNTRRKKRDLNNEKLLRLAEKTAGREPVASVAGSDVTIVEPEPEIDRITRIPLDL